MIPPERKVCVPRGDPQGRRRGPWERRAGFFSAENKGNKILLKFVTKAMTLSLTHQSGKEGRCWASKRGTKYRTDAPPPLVGRSGEKGVLLTSCPKSSCVPETAR